MISAANPYSDLGLAPQPAADKGNNKELGQDDFLTLMLAQIKSQDPMKPMENAEFITQMAQFSTVTGVQDLNTAFNDLAGALQVNQGLQAATLVGRHAMVEANTIDYTESTPQIGAVGLTSGASDVRVQVTDASGSLVREIHLGDQPPGLANFEWDGLDSSGQPATSGRYTFTAVAAADASGNGQAAFPTYLAGEVGRVTLNSTGSAHLELTGLGTVPFGDIRQIL